MGNWGYNSCTWPYEPSRQRTYPLSKPALFESMMVPFPFWWGLNILYLSFLEGRFRV